MTRDYLFDNCKVFLIFLVVAGHFVGPGASDNTFLLLLKWVIVSFHMPAFIFISCLPKQLNNGIRLIRSETACAC